MRNRWSQDRNGAHVLLNRTVRPTNEARLSGAELLEHVWNAWLDGVAVAVTSMPSFCYEKE